MKISVDDRELFTLTETQKKVIMNDINEDIFEEDMKRRLQYILTHKYERCLARLKYEWIPKFVSSGTPISINEEDFIKSILKHPQYKNRKQREEALK